MSHLIEATLRWTDLWSVAIWRASVEGAAAICIVWIIARWCKFLSPRVICWMWRAVCVKLLVALIWMEPVRIPVLPPPQVPPASAQQVWSAPQPAPVDNTMMPAVGFPSIRPQLVASENSITVANVLAVLWSIGVLCFVALTVREWITVRRLRRNAAIVVSSAILQSCQSEAVRLGTGQLAALRLSSQVDGPLLTGIVRPTVILPDNVETAFDQSELGLMLAHELAHLKRRDLLWNWLPTVVGWLFFFHPLVGLLRRGWFESQEAACDEMVIQKEPVGTAEYGRLLLKLSAHWPRRPRASLSAAGVLGAYRNLERRIFAMTRVRAFSRRGLIVTGGMILLVALLAILPWKLVAQDRTQETKAKTDNAAAAGYDLSHVVHFEIGRTQLPEGDKITIEEVRGTADTLTAGNMYEVKGTYVLNSVDKAMLSVFTTVKANDPQNEQFKNVPIQKTQTMMIEKGEGHFKLLFYMWQNGSPHVSFYPTGGGDDVGGVYFSNAIAGGNNESKGDTATGDKPNNASSAAAPQTSGQVPGKIYAWIEVDMTTEFGTPGKYRGIALIDPNTGAWAKLGNIGFSLRASADGERLAFEQSRSSKSADQCDIYWCWAQSMEPHPLVENANLPVWSPDGHQLVYNVGKMGADVGWRGAARKYDLATDKTEKLPVPETDEVDDWSQTGNWLVTVSDRQSPFDSGYQLYVMHPDGSEEKRVTEGPGLNCYPRFSPDGKEIVYTHQHHGLSSTWIVALEEKNPKQILVADDQHQNDPEEACWSPDGKVLAVHLMASKQQEIEGKKQWVATIGKTNDRICIVSPDGAEHGTVKLKDVTGLLQFGDSRSLGLARQLAIARYCCAGMR